MHGWFPSLSERRELPDALIDAGLNAGGFIAGPGLSPELACDVDLAFGLFQQGGGAQRVGEIKVRRRRHAVECERLVVAELRRGEPAGLAVKIAQMTDAVREREAVAVLTSHRDGLLI